MTTEQCPEVSFLDDSDKIPSPQQPLEERILFIQENMVSFVKQYNMPIVEVALVISKYIRILLDSLNIAARKSDEILPETILFPIPIDTSNEESVRPPDINSFPLEKLIDRVDQDRMDILEYILSSSFLMKFFL